jgi:hypothetical protein
VAVPGFPSWVARVAPSGPVALMCTIAVVVVSDAATEIVTVDPAVTESTVPGAGDGATQVIVGPGSVGRGVVSACTDAGRNAAVITAVRPTNTSGRRIAFITAFITAQRKGGTKAALSFRF